MRVGGMRALRRRALARQIIYGAAAASVPQLPVTTGLMAHYDFSDDATIFQDAARTTPAGVGSLIGGVADKSGNGHHLTRASDTTRPTRKNIGGKSAFFDSTHVLDIPTSLVLDRQASTTIVCVRMNRGPGSYNPTVLSMSQAAQSHGLYIVSDAKEGGEWRLFNASSRDSNIDGSRGAETVVAVNSSANVRIFAGAEVSGALTASASGTVAGGYFGRWDNTTGAASTKMHGHLYEAIFFSRTLSDAEIAQVQDYLSSKWGSMSRTEDAFLVFEGDSITEGVGSTGFVSRRVDDYAYPSQLARLHSTQPKYINLGEGGSKLEEMKGAGNLTAQLTQNSAYARRTVVLLAGTNDIASGFRLDGTTPQSATLIQGDFSTILSNIRLADAGAYVVVCTILPRAPFNSTQNTMMAAVNDWLIANSAGFDLVLNTHDAPGLSNSADATVYPDGIHPSDTGYATLASFVNAALVGAGRL